MKRVVCALIGTAATILALVLLTQTATGVGVTRYVATDGADTSTCISTLAPCLTVQYAVNQATEGDEVRVAGGVYQRTGGTAPLVSISKNISVTGGFSRADSFATSDPVARQTTLQKHPMPGNIYRVLDIRNSSPTVSGFTISQGAVNASDGGNVYIENGSPVISNSTIRDGDAQRGAGIFMVDSSATIVNNRILNNFAAAGSPSAAQGGGIYVLRGAPTITNNLIQENRANTVGFAADPQSFAAGGGVVLDTDSTTFTANTVLSNIVSSAQNGCVVGPIVRAGGINTVRSAATLQDNVIRGNRVEGSGPLLAQCGAGQAGAGSYAIGGGIAIDVEAASGRVQIIGGTIEGNEARGGLPVGNGGTVTNGSSAEAYGGGISVSLANPLIRGVTIISNTATGNSRNGTQTGGSNGNGGGIYTYIASPELDQLVLRGNIARSFDPNRYGFGGGMFVDTSSQITSAQNLALVENTSFNAGVFVTGTATLRVSQLTVARTLSAGAAVLVLNNATVAITNAIFAHNSSAIDTSNFGQTTVNGVLFYDNVFDSLGPAVVTNKRTGDPMFAPDLFHIQTGSAAIDTGVVSNVPNDIDGQLRPQGAGYDLGADEYQGVTSLSIAGPAAGQVNTVHIFTATIAPTAAVGPITYTWTATGQSTVVRAGGTSDSISFTWPDAGAKTVQVTAQNGIPGSSATTTVTINPDPPPGTTRIVSIGITYVSRDGP